MGRVFTFDDIEHARVPSPGDFERASQIFRAQLSEGFAEGTFDGGFVFGSVANNTANRRSDMDVFISLAEQTPAAYKAARTAVKAVHEDLHHRVAVGPIIAAKEDLSSGQHEMDRLFGVHLTHGMRLVIGRDPADYTVFDKRPPGDILAGYLAQKKRRLANAYTTFGRERTEGSGLQRMLELPTAVGRKAIQALDEIGYIKSEADSADKQAVASEAYALLAQEELLEGFTKLTRADRQYSQVLDGVLGGEVSQKQYDHFLESLHKQLPEAIGWVSMVEQRLLPKF